MRKNPMKEFWQNLASLMRFRPKSSAFSLSAEMAKVAQNAVFCANFRPFSTPVMYTMPLVGSSVSIEILGKNGMFRSYGWNIFGRWGLVTFGHIWPWRASALIRRHIRDIGPARQEGIFGGGEHGVFLGPINFGRQNYHNYPYFRILVKCPAGIFRDGRTAGDCALYSRYTFPSSFLIDPTTHLPTL